MYEFLKTKSNRLIATDVLSYLHNNNLITKHLHGFLSRQSTCTQLAETINDWFITFNSRFSVDSVYQDFTKAFVTVSHSKLIYMLKSYGINGNLFA